AGRTRVGRPPGRLVRHSEGEGSRRRRPGRPDRGFRAREGGPLRSPRHAWLEQQLDSQMRSGGKYETFKAYFSRPFGLDPSKVRLRPLKKGSHVIGGTILGRVGRTVPGMASHLNFAIRPAGRGAP